MSLLSRRGSKVNQVMHNNSFSAFFVFVSTMLLIFTLQDKFPDDTKEGKSRTLPLSRKSSKVTIRVSGIGHKLFKYASLNLALTCPYICLSVIRRLTHSSEGLR